MPTKEQIASVVARIEWIESMSFYREQGRAPEPVSDAALPWWEDLDRPEQQLVLDEYVDWEGFTEAEKEDVERRVLDGEDAEFWMDGIAVDRAEETAGSVSGYYEDGEPRMTDEEHSRYLADMAANWGLTVEQVDEHYEGLENATEEAAKWTSRESNEERDDRFKRLLFTGAPMPSGRDLPHLVLPPHTNSEEDVARVAKDLGELTGAKFGSWFSVPSDVGMVAQPGQYGTWGDLSEDGKLHVIDNWINWEGVRLEDRASLTLERLDLTKLDRMAADALLQAAGMETIGQVAEVERAGKMDEEQQTLVREQADDAAQRPLHEKGVRYEDEFCRMLDEYASRPSTKGRDKEIER